MAIVEARAPANIKIAGEHSVVYGGLSLSAAIGIYATARIEDISKEELQIKLDDLGKSAVLSGARLDRLYKSYSERDTKDQSSLEGFIESNNDIPAEALPYATIAARLSNEFGIKAIRKSATIHSDVPIQKGYASSAVCSASFAIALIASSAKKIDDKNAMDLIRDGERIVHKVETAGRLDVGPAYFGGFATFNSADGIKHLEVSSSPRFVIIDTGPKPPTSEMVKKVRVLYGKDEEGTKRIFRRIDDCVRGCIEALKSDNMKALGMHMSSDQELLRSLGVSSDRIDKALAIALQSGAYGAKLCGGGGGGMCAALVGSKADARRTVSELKAGGFEAYEIGISVEGAKSFLGKTQ